MSISLGFAFLLSATCALGINSFKMSSSFKQSSEKGDEGFQPSTEFARILSVSYKGTPPTNGSEAERPFEHVRKFDSGNSSPTEFLTNDKIVPGIFRVFTRAQKYNMSGHPGVTNGMFNYQRQSSASEQTTKDPRIPQGAASSHPFPLFHYQSDDAHAHTPYYVPESLNEVSSPHYDPLPVVPVRHEDSPHYHIHHYPKQQPAHSLIKFPLHSPKHTDGHHEYTTISSSSQNSEDSGLKEAVSKSLKFWIPTALLLTGASVLFPQRVKVPTNPTENMNNRQKRSTRHYIFTAGSNDSEAERFERILPVVLRRPNSDWLSNGNDSSKSQDEKSEKPSLVTSSSPVISTTFHQPLIFKRKSENSEVIAGKNVDQQDHSTESQSDALPFSQELASGKMKENNYLTITSAAFAPPPTISTTTTQASIERRKGRKVRVLLRARKNNGTSSEEQGEKPIGIKLKLDTNSTYYRKASTAKPSKDSAPEGKAKVLATTSTTLRTLVTFEPSVSPTTVRSLDATASVQNGRPSSNDTASIHGLTTKFPQSQQGLLQLLNESILSSSTAVPITNGVFQNKIPLLNQYDLSPEGPVVGLLTSVVDYKNESDTCQKRALCELAIRGSNPNATRFETFMWSLATLVPEAFTTFYDLEDTFAAIREQQCPRFKCRNPNLDIQETSILKP